jgi:hypothetical protein
MLTKNCIVCGKKIIKPINESLKNWNNRRKFCSRKCADIWKKGKRCSPDTEFKKGQKAIHPIKKGQHFSPKTEFKKGSIPWNKGKSGVMPIPWNKGKHFIQIMGKNNPNWKNGATQLREKIRKLLEYREWRTSIFQRDGWTCQKCGRKRKVGDRLIIEAHHIISFNEIIKRYKIKTVKDALSCKLLWDIKNGQTLCISCHKQTDSYLNQS